MVLTDAISYYFDEGREYPGQRRAVDLTYAASPAIPGFI
jgi:hypothetical protein